MSSGSRRGLRAFAGRQANAGSAAVVYQAATGNELGGGAEGGSEDSDGMFGHYDVATLGAPRRAVRTFRRDELLYKVQDAAIRGLPDQLERLMQMEGTKAWPTTSGTRGVAVPLPRLSLLEEKDTRGRTPLWLTVENASKNASKNGVAVIQLLAMKGANINATASVKLSEHERKVFDGMIGRHKQQVGMCSAFMLATRRGNLQVMRALQELGADVQRADDDGRSPLCVAATSCGGSSNAALQLLISIGVDLEQSDRMGMTPLACACAHGNLYAACTLVEAGAQKMALDREGAPPFFQSVKFGYFEMLRSMLKRWWPTCAWPSLLLDTVDSRGRTACHYAASRSEPDCIRALWELAGYSGHDLLMKPDAAMQTPLSHACSSYYAEYHQRYKRTGALRSVQLIVALGSYTRRELSEAIVELVRMDTNTRQCPLLGKEYYERGLTQSEDLEDAQGAKRMGFDSQANERSECGNVKMWSALEETLAERAGLMRVSAAEVDSQPLLSGRQLAIQWLQMAVAVPAETRALILSHQRLAWASVAHPRLSGSSRSAKDSCTTQLGTTLMQGSPAAILSIDLVGQVAESFGPQVCRFADYPVCWRLVFDARLAWTPAVDDKL